MDTSYITRGDDLMVFTGNGTETKRSIAFATSHTLTITADPIEISCKDSGIWKESIVNKMGWEITTDNLYCDQEYNKLYSTMIAREPVDVVFGTAYNVNVVDGVDSPTAYMSPTATNNYTGKAIITNLTANAASGDNATFSATFQGTGKLNYVAAT